MFLSLNSIGFEDSQATSEKTCIKLLEFLMKKDASVINSQDRLGRSLFHYAAMHGLEDLTLFLFSSGASFNL